MEIPLRSATYYDPSVNEKTIHTRRNVRKSGLAAERHSPSVCAGEAGMFGREDISSVIVATEPVKAAEDREVVQEKQEDREQGRSR